MDGRDDGLSDKNSDYVIKDSGKHREFGTGARRDRKTGKGAYDLVPWEVIHHIAIHFQKGAEKYTARNWEKGIDCKEYYDSGMRHMAQFYLGLGDENHLISAIWNFICLYQTVLWIQRGELSEDLYNLPYKSILPMPWEEYLRGRNNDEKSEA